VQETAFGFCPAKGRSRRIVTGVNWSPGILNPFRELGRFGQSLDSVLERLYVGRNEPVVILLHIACPRVSYTDRGKSAVVIGGDERGPVVGTYADRLCSRTEEDADEEGEDYEDEGTDEEGD
jgi:hypothetical protein